jgi:peptidoglycan/LPS O-acetylase OafA/YrhL
VNEAVAARQTTKNLSIEGLRGFLAGSVLFFHVYEMGAKTGFYPGTKNPIATNLGAYVVAIFFCVSGYLILQTLVGKYSISEFFKNRIARIYPVFLLLHIAMFTAGPWFGYEWMGKLRDHPGAYLASFFSNLFFLPGLLNLPIAQKNAWSLSFEALFYILAALSYWSLLRIKTWPGRSILAAVCCLAALVIAMQPIGAFFLIGVVVFKLVKAGRLPIINSLAAVAAFAGGLIAFPTLIAASMVFGAVFFAAAVKGHGILGRFLSSNPMRLMGKISYSLYLTHPFALEPMRILLMKSSGHIHPIAAGVCFLVLGPATATCVSYLSFVFIEKKLTRALREWWAGRWNAVKAAPVQPQLGEWQVMDSGRVR